MKWLKWGLVFAIAALAIWLMSGKKDAINIGKKIRDKMRKNQNIIRLN